MSVDNLTPSIANGNGWDRPPAPRTARAIQRAQERRARALRGIGLALGRKPHGCNLTTLERAQRIADLYDEYIHAGLRILEGELL
jgi:hypothetical protein